MGSYRVAFGTMLAAGAKVERSIFIHEYLISHSEHTLLVTSCCKSKCFGARRTCSTGRSKPCQRLVMGFLDEIGYDVSSQRDVKCLKVQNWP